MLLLNPGIGVNTREAYQNCHPDKPPAPFEILIDLPPETWKNNIVNDFEEYAFDSHPQIRILKEELYRAGALFSLMSGSGSSVFGIFTKRPQVPDKLKEFVIWQGVL